MTVVIAGARGPVGQGVPQSPGQPPYGVYLRARLERIRSLALTTATAETTDAFVSIPQGVIFETDSLENAHWCETEVTMLPAMEMCHFSGNSFLVNSGNLPTIRLASWKNQGFCSVSELLLDLLLIQSVIVLSKTIKNQECKSVE